MDEENTEERLPGGKKNILFVDDDEDIAILGEKVLKKLGYEVTAFTSSKEALEKFRVASATFDLIVTDYTMPGMTGLQLAAEASKIRPGIPIILISGVGRFIARENLEKCGICSCIMKPFKIDDLAGEVRRLLDGHSGVYWL